MQTQPISDDDFHEIESFYRDMARRTDGLPTYSDGSPRDDDGTGAMLELELLGGVTLVMDWAYLDAPSTYLLVDPDAEGYDNPQARHLCDCGDVFDTLDQALSDVFGSDIWTEYDPQFDGVDCYHIGGVTPY